MLAQEIIPWTKAETLRSNADARSCLTELEWGALLDLVSDGLRWRWADPQCRNEAALAQPAPEEAKEQVVLCIFRDGCKDMQRCVPEGRCCGRELRDPPPTASEPGEKKVPAADEMDDLRWTLEGGEVGGVNSPVAASEPGEDTDALARVIAHGLGYDWDTLYEHKQDWVADRGKRHDVNTPYRMDFREAADAVRASLRPSPVVEAARKVEIEYSTLHGDEELGDCDELREAIDALRDALAAHDGGGDGG